ncbi:hypothetical protein diail_4474 [Diaporthe ilicicola]|nr:hypothetical protein diail_4474 [Diaporthe ilicicola]
MIYGQGNTATVPSLDLLTFLFDSEHCTAQDDTPIHAEAEDPTKSILTKSQARLLTKQLAHFLRTQYDIGKVGSGRDIVLTVSSGQSRLPCLFFGVIAAGGVYAAASPSSSAAGLATLAREAGPARLLICSEDTRDTAISAAEQAGISKSHVLVLASWPEVSLQSADGSIRCDFTSKEKVLDWKTVTDPAELANTPICLIYSSGTTSGAPKGVLLSHTNMVAEAYLPSSVNRRAWSQSPRLGQGTLEPPLGPGYRTLAHLPPAHVSGVQGYFVNPLLDGGIVYWMGGGTGSSRSFDMAAFLRHNETLAITSFFTAPPVYEAVARCAVHRPGLVTERTFRALRVAYSGGARLRLGSDLAGAARRLLGDPNGGRPLLISQTWGATETAGAVTHMPPDRAGWDSLGSVGGLLPNMLMRLVDDDGRDVRVGMPGEALLKGPVVMMGYHNNAEANAAAFTADGWFRTGDVVRVEGDLVIYVDRKQDLITHNGLKLYPSELENTLLSHPGVVDAAVVGMSASSGGHSENEGEIPRAFVVVAPNGGQATPTVLELLDFAQQKLGNSIGQAHGSGARSQVHGSIAFYAALFQKTCALGWAGVTREAEKYVAPLEASCPRYLDEMRGIAEGAGVTFLDVLALNVRTEITFGLYTSGDDDAAAAAAINGATNGVNGVNGVNGKPAAAAAAAAAGDGKDFPSDGCTSLAFTSPSGTSYLAQNWDWQPAQATNLIIARISQPGLPAIAMVTEAGIIGKIGLNSAGVGCCLNAIRARGVDAARLPVHVALRAVLESASAASAVDTVVRRLGGVAGSGHVLVADGTGSSGCARGLEFAGGRPGAGVVGPDGRGRVVHTNHLLLEHPGVDEPGWLPDSGDRLARMRALTDGGVLEGEGVGIARVVELFKDEDGFPFSINRLKVADGESQTLFTIVMDLSRKEALVKVGRPTEDGEEIWLGF